MQEPFAVMLCEDVAKGTHCLRSREWSLPDTETSAVLILDFLPSATVGESISVFPVLYKLARYNWFQHQKWPEAKVPRCELLLERIPEMGKRLWNRK